ncbi:MAG: S8 family serine peptidase [Actinomycetota bacterium]
MRPAWSSSFEEGTLREAVTELPPVVTREWAWDGADGAGVDVAIIDSGIDAEHPAVGGVEGWIAFEYDEDSPGETRVLEGPHEDLFGHGTACAAIIRRVAPRARLHSVRVLGTNLKTRGVVFAAGLRWAVEHGMRVINLSLSSSSRDYFALFHELADLAYFRGALLVSAINNVPGASYPSEYASVVSVAANDATDPFAIDYNPSPPVEFGAPGIDLEVAWRGGGTMRSSGNSFAAPHVAGLAARILSKHPTLTPFQMKTVLHAVSRNVVPAS